MYTKKNKRVCVCIRSCHGFESYIYIYIYIYIYVHKYIYTYSALLHAAHTNIPREIQLRIWRLFKSLMISLETMQKIWRVFKNLISGQTSWRTFCVSMHVCIHVCFMVKDMACLAVCMYVCMYACMYICMFYGQKT